MNVEMGNEGNEAAQFHYWEYIYQIFFAVCFCVNTTDLDSSLKEA